MVGDGIPCAAEPDPGRDGDEQRERSDQCAAPAWLHGSNRRPRDPASSGKVALWTSLWPLVRRSEKPFNSAARAFVATMA